MKIDSINNDIYISDIKEFEPKHIFENGQCFRWYKDNDDYLIIVDKYLSKIIKKDDTIIIENGGTIEDYYSFWENYFDFKRDYSLIRNDLSKIDDRLKIACEYGEGLRILNQDLFEMIISFIISANNQIPNIKKSIEKISMIVGNKIGEYNGSSFYKFPSLLELSKVSINDLKDIARIGYRAEYIYDTCNMLLNKEVDLDNISNLSYEQAHSELCKLKGVGQKVADCILLFGNKRNIAFPVDTWVIKFMNEYYLKEKTTNIKKIKQEGLKIFKDNAGLAQQYLFYYSRENKIGKKVK